jgi:predicted N-formylglutamate amidohydrolase
MNFIISCEHGGKNIPKKYFSLFKNKKRILNSHRGWDIGALVLAKKVSKDLLCPLYFSETSRLLIDLNRSLHHPNLFSEFSKSYDKTTRQEIINKIYIPYREKIENHIKNANDHSPVIHLSIHSFTPVLNNVIRHADIGLLYDPARKSEKEFCNKLRVTLINYFPDLVIRSNYPYKGSADGFTPYLRKQFNERKYSGIEIEINQKHIIKNDRTWLMIKNALRKSLINNL